MQTMAPHKHPHTSMIYHSPSFVVFIPLLVFTFSRPGTGGQDSVFLMSVEPMPCAKQCKKNRR